MGYIGNTPADKYQTLQKQSFTTSATTSYTLSYSVTNPQEIALFINNVRQNPNSSYTVSGTTLTLSSATASTDVMYAVFLGKSVGTIGVPAGGVGTSQIIDANITTAKIADNAITLAKMASGTDGNLISYDASGNPVAVATGNDGQVLTSTGAGSPPVFETLATSGNTPNFCVIEGGQQTLQHNTYTNLDFGTEIVDSNNAFTSNKFTVPSGQGGTYYLECQVNFYDAQGNLSSGMLALWKGNNGTKLSNLYNVYTGAEAAHLSFSVSTLAVLNAGDVIGAAATITTTDGLSVTSYGGDGGTRIMGFKLA